MCTDILHTNAFYFGWGGIQCTRYCELMMRVRIGTSAGRDLNHWPPDNHCSTSSELPALFLSLLLVVSFWHVIFIISRFPNALEKLGVINKTYFTTYHYWPFMCINCTAVYKHILPDSYLSLSWFYTRVWVCDWWILECGTWVYDWWNWRYNEESPRSVTDRLAVWVETG